MIPDRRKTMEISNYFENIKIQESKPAEINSI